MDNRTDHVACLVALNVFVQTPSVACTQLLSSATAVTVVCRSVGNEDLSLRLSDRLRRPAASNKREPRRNVSCSTRRPDRWRVCTLGIKLIRSTATEHRATHNEVAAARVLMDIDTENLEVVWPVNGDSGEDLNAMSGNQTDKGSREFVNAVEHFGRHQLLLELLPSSYRNLRLSCHGGFRRHCACAPRQIVIAPAPRKYCRERYTIYKNIRSNQDQKCLLYLLKRLASKGPEQLPQGAMRTQASSLRVCSSRHPNSQGLTKTQATDVRTTLIAAFNAGRHGRRPKLDLAIAALRVRRSGGSRGRRVPARAARRRRRVRVHRVPRDDVSAAGRRRRPAWQVLVLVALLLLLVSGCKGSSITA